MMRSVDLFKNRAGTVDKVWAWVCAGVSCDRRKTWDARPVYVGELIAITGVGRW